MYVVVKNDESNLGEDNLESLNDLVGVKNVPIVTDPLEAHRVAQIGSMPLMPEGTKACPDCQNDKIRDYVKHPPHHTRSRVHVNHDPRKQSNPEHRRLPDGRMTKDDLFGVDIPHPDDEEHNSEGGWFHVGSYDNTWSDDGSTVHNAPGMSEAQVRHYLEYLFEDAPSKGEFYDTDLNKELGIGHPSTGLIAHDGSYPPLTWFHPREDSSWGAAWGPRHKANVVSVKDSKGKTKRADPVPKLNEEGEQIVDPVTGQTLMSRGRAERRKTGKGMRVGGLGTEAFPDLGHSLKFYKNHVLNHKKDAEQREQDYALYHPELHTALSNGMRVGQTPCTLCLGHGTTTGNNLLSYLGGDRKMPRYGSVASHADINEGQMMGATGSVNESHEDHEGERATINHELIEHSGPFGQAGWSTPEDPLGDLVDNPHGEYLCLRCAGTGVCSTCGGDKMIDTIKPNQTAEEYAQAQNQASKYKHGHSLARHGGKYGEVSGQPWLRPGKVPVIGGSGSAYDRVAEIKRRERAMQTYNTLMQRYSNGEIPEPPEYPEFGPLPEGPEMQDTPSFLQTEPEPGQFGLREQFVKPPQPQQPLVGVRHGHPKRPESGSGTGFAAGSHPGTMAASLPLKPETQYSPGDRMSFAQLVASGMYPEGPGAVGGEQITHPSDPLGTMNWVKVVDPKTGGETSQLETSGGVLNLPGGLEHWAGAGAPTFDTAAAHGVPDAQSREIIPIPMLPSQDPQPAPPPVEEEPEIDYYHQYDSNDKRGFTLDENFKTPFEQSDMHAYKWEGVGFPTRFQYPKTVKVGWDAATGLYPEDIDDWWDDALIRLANGAESGMSNKEVDEERVKIWHEVASHEKAAKKAEKKFFDAQIYRYPNDMWADPGERFLHAALNGHADLAELYEKSGSTDIRASPIAERALYRTIKNIHPDWEPSEETETLIPREELMGKGEPLDHAWSILKSYATDRLRGRRVGGVRQTASLSPLNYPSSAHL